MSLERTLSILKPDAVSRNLLGPILHRFEKEGLNVIAARMTQLSKRQAEGFYAVHAQRPFFRELVDSMCSNPVLLLVLEGQNAVLKNRDIMGATNPADAKEGTLRKLHAISIGENTVHGSDSLENAKTEIAWFFAESELFPKT